jgi:hypothetical protein
LLTGEKVKTEVEIAFLGSCEDFRKGQNQRQKGRREDH